MKCVCCGKVQNNGISEKFRISEPRRAEKLLEAARYHMDEVYTRICDLKTIEHVFGADLYYHNHCSNL